MQDKVTAKDLEARYSLIKTTPKNTTEGLTETINKGLSSTPKSLPYFLLYDDAGSDIFEDICKLEEYYPTVCEADILETQIDEILSSTPPFTLLVELGSGSSTKTRTLIKGMLNKLPENNATKTSKMTYAPIDISGTMLNESSIQLLKEFQDPRFNVTAVNGFYKDGLEAVRRMFPNDKKLVIWLGSSIGNLEEEEAIPFLKDIQYTLSSEDRFLIGMDLMKDKQILKDAYDDPKGVTASFVLNILKHVNNRLGGEYFSTDDFRHHAVVNTDIKRVEISLECQRDFSVEIPSLSEPIRFTKGELIGIEHCYKYTFESIDGFAKKSDFTCERRWLDRKGKFSVNMFAPLSRGKGNSHSQSSEKEIRAILESGWGCSDSVFSLLPTESDFLAKPIDLRNPFVFYVGHLVSFTHSHILTHTLNVPSFNPQYEYLFSRGIDPSVDDPTQCHAHPEAPTSWPSLDKVFSYQRSVRQKALLALPQFIEKLGAKRTASLCAEHELMHSETLLYMIMQMDTTRLSHAAAGAVAPNDLSFERTSKSPPSYKSLERMIRIPAGKATLGVDFDSIDFGWDNEFPKNTVAVEEFSIGEYPITNGQFYDFVRSGNYEDKKYWEDSDWKWKQSAKLDHPTLWRVNGAGDFFLRTLWGEVPLLNVWDWPVNVSWAEANAYAKWKGGRLPTEAEFTKAAYANENSQYPWGDAAPVPGVHGNFGFSRWCPAPVTAYPAGASAYGVKDLVSNGWEWTKTKFAPFEGFIPHIPHYPGYSSDFFDDNHYVLLGASWATKGSLVRRSFRNWYQPHYQYMFSKFRVVSCNQTTTL